MFEILLVVYAAIAFATFLIYVDYEEHAYLAAIIWPVLLIVYIYNLIKK